ncbi:MAG: nucleoside kinase [Anaerolineae bacterium]|nr:nucleoside kinase [Anaerolineae bacterium]
MSDISSSVHLSEPRLNVHVTFPDGTVLEAPKGTPVEHFLQKHRELHPDGYPSEIMGGIVDSRLRELSYLIQRDASISPVTLSESDGRRIYRRTLVLLLVAAVNELFPGVEVSVSYAVPDGGYYCMVKNHASFTDDELKVLDDHMHAIAEADNPIIKQVMKLSEAIEMYESRGNVNKVRLMKQRTRGDLNIYALRGHADYYYGYMLPSTRYLKLFRLVNTPTGGFILQYPRSSTPNMLNDEVDNEGKIARVFERAEELAERLGVEDIGRLNEIVSRDHIQELILVAEAIHEQQISTIAQTVYDAYHERELRLVLIAGPSSSGKTTFSKRLAIHLLAYGLRPFTVELDNYFLDRELTPRDESGNYDFEALEAINLPLFNRQLQELFAGEHVALPRFNFKLGKSVEGTSIKLDSNHILVIEGIHGINPRLVTDIPDSRIYRIYVSALTQLNIDNQNRIPTTDVRLLRRICRDAYNRGHNATATIGMWPSVRRGEKRNIFPYQENANVIFNSALSYELASLKPIAEPLLLQVPVGTPAYIEANRLLSFIRWVQPLTPEQQMMIPDTSLIREFIGGSILGDYLPGGLHTKDV